MKYIATALADVSIRASMPTTKVKKIGGGLVPVPSSEWKWVKITMGSTVEVGLVLGLHPSCVPEQIPTTIGGVPMIPLESYSPETLPRDFHGCLRLEVAEE